MAKRCKGKVAYIGLVGREALYRDGKPAYFKTRGDALVTAAAVSGRSRKGIGSRRVCVAKSARFQ